MCEFVSWIEYEGKPYFLINGDIETKEGQKLLAPDVKDDICGHGAIEAYYPELKGKGTNKEGTDFSTPDNFPLAIVEALKAGKMSRIGITLEILNEDGKAEYEKIKQPAFAEYLKIEQPAYAEYLKIEQQAYADHYAEYLKIEQPAFAKYEKIKQQAYAEYQKIEQQAYAEYQKIEQPAYAKIVSQKKYRINAWQ